MMHPSTINGKASFSTTTTTTSYYYNNYHHQRTTTCFPNFCNYMNHENVPSQVLINHCHPAIPLESEQPHPPAINIVRSELFQQQQPPFTNAAAVIAGSNHYKTTTTTDHHMQYSSYINNGRFVGADDGRVIMKDKCLTGRKLCSKKDRHSKINTARGPRDRRMRLSLDVAKRFFRLQDILGLDKASNTIDWLLTKSKPAIQALILPLPPQHLKNHLQGCSSLLMSNSPPASSSSSSSSSASDQGEVVMSGSVDDDQSMEKFAAAIDDLVMLINNNKQAKISSSNCSRPSNNYKKKQKKLDRGGRVRWKSGVCNIVDHCLAKETREKARARARKRTTEKKITSIKLAAAAACVDQHCYSKLLRPSSSLDDQLADQNINHRIAGSWIPFGEINQLQATSSAAAAAAGSNYHFQLKQEAAGAGINNIDIVGGDHNSMMSSSSNPSLLFNYQHNAGSPSHDEQHDQLSDFQILGKPWELGEFN